MVISRKTVALSSNRLAIAPVEGWLSILQRPSTFRRRFASTAQGCGFVYWSFCNIRQRHKASANDAQCVFAHNGADFVRREAFVHQRLRHLHEL